MPWKNNYLNVVVRSGVSSVHSLMRGVVKLDGSVRKLVASLMIGADFRPWMINAIANCNCAQLERAKPYQKPQIKRLIKILGSDCEIERCEDRNENLIQELEDGIETTFVAPFRSTVQREDITTGTQMGVCDSKKAVSILSLVSFTKSVHNRSLFQIYLIKQMLHVRKFRNQRKTRSRAKALSGLPDDSISAANTEEI